jgi:hypothetical protein
MAPLDYFYEITGAKWHPAQHTRQKALEEAAQTSYGLGAAL